MRSGLRTDWLFAYGTLIDGRAPKGLREKLRRHLIAAHPAQIAARQVRTRAWYPAAVPDANCRLAGLALKLRAPRALWPLLDAYENAHRFGKSEFVRVRVPVWLQSGECIEAWAYLLRQEKGRP